MRRPLLPFIRSIKTVPGCLCQGVKAAFAKSYLPVTAHRAPHGASGSPPQHGSGPGAGTRADAPGRDSDLGTRGRLPLFCAWGSGSSRRGRSRPPAPDAARPADPPAGFRARHDEVCALAGRDRAGHLVNACQLRVAQGGGVEGKTVAHAAPQFRFGIAAHHAGTVRVGKVVRSFSFIEPPM